MTISRLEELGNILHRSHPTLHHLCIYMVPADRAFVYERRVAVITYLLGIMAEV